MPNRDERWRELCAQAAVEQDPKRLLELVTEITRLLGEKYDRARKADESPELSEDKPSNT
jgi:hypothetical protein